MTRPKGLGRGLEALLGKEVVPATETLGKLAVDRIRPGKYQPRTRMDEEALAELAASIRTQGVMQPVIVRPLSTDSYELIAGERRWRAAQLAGLAEVPAVIRPVDDEAALAMSLIENIQREDLNPLEEASGLQRLTEEFDLTHDQAADAVGRSRSATSNLLRLLKLSKPVQAMLSSGAIEMGHARALLALDGARQVEAAHRISARGLSVREAEALVNRLLRASGGAAGRNRKTTDRDLARLEQETSEQLGTTVEIKPAGKKGSGRVIVHYASLEHLDEILRKLR